MVRNRFGCDWVSRYIGSHGREPMNLPTCTGYRTGSDDFGEEWDCGAIHKAYCEDCLCNYKRMGGLWHPVTGKKVNRWLALVLYGRVSWKNR
jgi:hypothetical protein